MNKKWTLLLVMCAQVTYSQTSDAGNFEIPRQFWGEYNQNIRHCGTGLNDTRLRVSWNNVRFYESTATVEGIIRNADGSIVVFAKFENHRETWSNIFKMSLSADKRRITVTHPQNVDSDQSSMTRQRCP
jgi:hypothetical protein